MPLIAENHTQFSTGNMSSARRDDSIEDLGKWLQETDSGSRSFDELDVLGDDFDPDALLTSPILNNSGGNDALQDKTDREDSFGTFDDDNPYEILPIQHSYAKADAPLQPSCPQQSLLRNDHAPANSSMQRYASQSRNNVSLPPNRNQVAMDDSGGSYMSYQMNAERMRQDSSPQPVGNFSSSMQVGYPMTQQPLQHQQMVQRCQNPSRQMLMRSVSYQPDLTDMRQQQAQMTLSGERALPNRSISYTAEYGSSGRNALQQMQMMQGTGVEPGLSRTIHGDSTAHATNGIAHRGNEFLGSKSEQSGDSYYSTGSNGNMYPGVPTSMQAEGFAAGTGPSMMGNYGAMPVQTPAQLREAMEKLTQRMQRSAMSRNMVKQMSGQGGVARSNSARHMSHQVTMGRGLARTPAVLQRHNSGHSLDDPLAREVPLRRPTEVKHRLQYPQRGSNRHNSQQSLGDPQHGVYPQNL